MKVVTHIDGRRTMRPCGEYPDAEYWVELKDVVRSRQQDPDGSVHCGTCWTTEQACGSLDLHHRHYDNWGKESPQDMILLCRRCHEAITSRIREERFSLEGLPGIIPEAKLADYRPETMDRSGISEKHDNFVMHKVRYRP